MHDRVVELEAHQQIQALELESLRTRTATALSAWYEQNAMQESRRWNEWESRLLRIEQSLRRREAATRREQAAV